MLFRQELIFTQYSWLQSEDTPSQCPMMASRFFLRMICVSSSCTRINWDTNSHWMVAHPNVHTSKDICKKGHTVCNNASRTRTVILSNPAWKVFRLYGAINAIRSDTAAVSHVWSAYSVQRMLRKRSTCLHITRKAALKKSFTLTFPWCKR